MIVLVVHMEGLPIVLVVHTEWLPIVLVVHTEGLPIVIVLTPGNWFTPKDMSCFRYSYALRNNSHPLTNSLIRGQTTSKPARYSTGCRPIVPVYSLCLCNYVDFVFYSVRVSPLAVLRRLILIVFRLSLIACIINLKSRWNIL